MPKQVSEVQCAMCGIHGSLSDGIPMFIGELFHHYSPPWTGSMDARTELRVCEIDYWCILRLHWELLGRDWQKPEWWTVEQFGQAQARYDRILERFMQRYDHEYAPNTHRGAP